MKTLKTLIRIDLGLLALIGWSATFGYSRTVKGLDGTVWYSSEDDPVLKLLGMGMFLLGGLLLLASELMLAGNRRRFGRWLAAANLGIAVTAFIRGTENYPTEWVLLLVPLVMAILLTWASTLPVDLAAELSELRIPDEVRQALLRQVGEAAAQEERNRLARDLHDSIKQQLFTINVGAATAQERWERDPAGARAALADVRRSAREAMVEMQAMLHQLRPQALTSTPGLVEALREQAEALGYRSGAQVTVELGPEIPDDRMPPGAREALFRIAQEALANVARHARAGTVRVWIGREGEEAVLWVIDDGQGFNPEAAVSGMGLRNLRERAAALRGRVDIESAPGSGSAVRARIPLLAPAAPPSKFLADQIRPYREGLWFPWALSALVVSKDSLSWGDVGFYILMPLLFALWIRTSAMADLRRAPGASLSDISWFRFFLHLSVLLWVFAATVGAWSIWAQSGAHSENERLTWLAMSGLGLVWVLFELAVFHRWSERRREWRTLVRSGRWSWKVVRWTLVMILWMILWVLESPLSSIQMVLYAVMMAFLLYVLSRQPRLEGSRP